MNHKPLLAPAPSLAFLRAYRTVQSCIIRTLVQRICLNIEDTIFLSRPLFLSSSLYLLINNQHARRPCHAAFATPPPCQTNTLPLKKFSVPLRRRRRVSPVPHCLPNAFPPPPSLPKLWRNFLCYLHFALKLLLFFFLLLFFLLLSLLSLLLPVCCFLLCIIYTHTNTHTRTQGLWLQLAKGGLGLRYQFDARHSPQNFTLTLTPVVKYVCVCVCVWMCVISLSMGANPCHLLQQ